MLFEAGHGLSLDAGIEDRTAIMAGLEVIPGVCRLFTDRSPSVVRREIVRHTGP